MVSVVSSALFSLLFSCAPRNSGFPSTPVLYLSNYPVPVPSVPKTVISLPACFIVTNGRSINQKIIGQKKKKKICFFFYFISPFKLTTCVRIPVKLMSWSGQQAHGPEEEGEGEGGEDGEMTGQVGAGGWLRGRNQALTGESLPETVSG